MLGRAAAHVIDQVGQVLGGLELDFAVCAVHDGCCGGGRLGLLLVSRDLFVGRSPSCWPVHFFAALT